MAIMFTRSLSLLASSPLISLLFVLVLAIDGQEFTIKEATIDGIQRAFTENRLTSRQLVDFYLNQIETLNPVLRGVIEVNPDAVDQAKKADRERKRNQGRQFLGDLHGVPVLLKDSIGTKDKLNATVGSYALLGSVVARDATVVERLRKAGAVIMGKASVNEWYGFRSWSIPEGWCARSGQGLVLPQPPKRFRQFFFPSKDLKKLLDLPVHKQRAPLLLNFIPTYKSVLSDVPKKKKKKSQSPPSAITPSITSTSRPDQGSTSDPTEQPSTSAPQLIPPSQRRRRRRTVFAVEMGRQKAVAIDLLANIPADVDIQPAQTQPQPKQKQKKLKKAQRKATVTQIDTEDTLPISKLAESEKTSSAVEKRPADAKPSQSTRSKRPRSESATTSGSMKSGAPWAPPITLEDRPVKVDDSADDINVGVAFTTALLLLGDLDRNAEMTEYENFALMLQHSAKAIQHAHSFSMQSFETKKALADKTREVASLQKASKRAEAKMKTLEDQAEAAIKAKDDAEEKADAAEAIKKVLEAEKRQAKEKMTQAQKELQDALATKEAEIKAADEKAYAEGVANVTADYERQVKQACNKGFTLGWMALLKKLEVLEDSPLRNTDVLALPFPPTPSQSDDDSESEEEALVRKSKEAAEAKSPTQNEQVLDLTQDEEGEEVPKDAIPEKATSKAPIADKSLEQTLQEIDAELAAEKAADMSS